MIQRGWIYKITNTVNGKYYFGQTSRSPSIRYKEHLKRKHKEGSRHLYAAMDMYGNDKFTFQIVDVVESNDLINDLYEREKWWIEVYDATNQDKGYNMNKGGRGYKHTKTAIEAIRDFDLNSKFIYKGDIRKRVHKNELDKYLADGWIIGRNMSEEHREALRNGYKKRIPTEEELKAKSKYTKEHWNEIFGLECRKKAWETRRKNAEKNGYYFTEEQRKKMSDSHLGYCNSPESYQKMLETKRKNGTYINSGCFKKGKHNTKEEINKMLETKRKRGNLINSGCFKKGQPSTKANLGRIRINKDGKNKFIFKKDLEQYINDGWILGGTPHKTPAWNKRK